ncbi:MAG: tyrosine-type recombinase/integrase [Oscillatoriaceae cyanobacterium Prado104]|nr:tyrosine-type recombinase/integrase [Oscillatoriaceae cyanobacterium Prado104]
MVKAFESQKYGTYGYYVGFLALTGFRPEEAIALTWDDLKQNEKGSYIRVNKAHSKGELKATKTYDSRLFPCNVQLSEFISKIPKISNKNNLVFPSNRKDYIDQHNFLSRYWHPVVWELFDRGEISQYLPCYNLRHSFITRLVRDGIDPATVAKLAGNSPEIIMKHYLSARNDVVLPEL